MFARSGRSASRTQTLLAAAALTLTFVGTTLADPRPMQGSRVVRVSDGCVSDNQRDNRRNDSRWGGGWKIEVPRHEERRRSLDASCLETCVRIDGQEVKVHLSVTRTDCGELKAKLKLSTDFGCVPDIDAVALKVTGSGEQWKQTLDKCNSRDHDELIFEAKDGPRVKACDEFKVSLRIYTESDDVDTASWRDVEVK